MEYNRLSREIEQFCNDKKATMKDEQEWKEVVSKLESVVCERSPHCRLVLVGSCGSGLGNKTSDLDLVAYFTNFSYTGVSSLGEALRRHPGYRRIEVITGAKVPIVTFTENQYGKECDISIGNTASIFNCHLIKGYLEMDDRVKPMVIFLVRWAKERDIIGAKEHMLASFVMKLLIISYLQVGCSPAVLPSLQSFDKDQYSTFQSSTQLHNHLQGNVPRNVRSYHSLNKDSLGKLVHGFFRYYSKFNWQSTKICVESASLRHWPPGVDRGRGDVCLFVQCPMTYGNTARSVFKAHIFERIKREFRMADEKLTTDQSLSSLRL